MSENIFATKENKSIFAESSSRLVDHKRNHFEIIKKKTAPGIEYLFVLLFILACGMNVFVTWHVIQNGGIVSRRQ